MLDYICRVFYYWYLRPVVKWYLFKSTRLHQLQRLCQFAPEGAIRTKKVEQSLELSTTSLIESMVLNLNCYVENPIDENVFLTKIVDNAVNTVLKAKRINPYTHLYFPIMFGACVEKIWGYKRLYHIVEELRTTPYDCENLKHEQKLLRLWKLLMPNVPLEDKISKQWQDIGFQSYDPKTDFRDMGILGLENLLYFAKEYNSCASHVLCNSLDPQYGYTFAVVGISITSMAWNLLKSGTAKTHYYNLTKRIPTLKSFHELYCFLFYEFDMHWNHYTPKSIISFPYVLEDFESNILKLLENNETIFKINFSVDE